MSRRGADESGVFGCHLHGVREVFGNPGLRACDIYPNNLCADLPVLHVASPGIPCKDHFVDTCRVFSPVGWQGIWWGYGMATRVRPIGISEDDEGNMVRSQPGDKYPAISRASLFLTLNAVFPRVRIVAFPARPSPSQATFEAACQVAAVMMRCQPSDRFGMFNRLRLGYRLSRFITGSCR
jgi:hypothetical protein